LFVKRHDAKDVKMLKAKQFNKERGEKSALAKASAAAEG
jgi:hypothetical protein